MFVLCMSLILSCVFAHEVTGKPSSVNGVTFQIQKNYTTTSSHNDTGKNINNITSERIIQPLQVTKIERILETSPNVSKRIENRTGTLENFKPSPQLETYYEYNKVPVVPALPEAKTFGSFSNPGYPSINSWDERNSGSNYQVYHNSWSEDANKPNLWGENIKTTSNFNTEPPWSARVKFPSSNINENTYKFIGHEENVHKHQSPVSFQTTTEGYSFNTFVETPKHKHHNNKPGFWQKLMGINKSENKNTVAVQKTFSDYNLLEKPPHHGSISAYEASNPLKKIIKLLTAIIPIGLFISALTPTVITVTSVNDTQSRYRTDDPKHQEVANRLASSLKYAEQLRSCEDRILCELLVAATTSKNSEEHIKNLLDTFTEQEDLQSKKEDLLKVFDAVKKEDCTAVVCTGNRNKS